MYLLPYTVTKHLAKLLLAITCKAGNSSNDKYALAVIPFTLINISSLASGLGMKALRNEADHLVHEKL